MRVYRNVNVRALLFQYDKVTVQKARATKPKQLWDELEHRLQPRPYRPTSVHDLTNALVAEREQIPAARFQKLVEKFPRRVEVVKAA